MPLYDYRCTRCFRHFEARRSVEDRAHAFCPTCGYMGTKLAAAPPVVWSKFQGATARDRVRKDLTSRIERGPR